MGLQVPKFGPQYWGGASPLVGATVGIVGAQWHSAGVQAVDTKFNIPSWPFYRRSEDKKNTLLHALT